MFEYYMYSHNRTVTRYYLHRYRARYSNRAAKAPFYFLFNLFIVKLATTAISQPKHEVPEKPKYVFFPSKKTKKAGFLIKKRSKAQCFRFH